jgi:hypothetical protein
MENGKFLSGDKLNDSHRDFIKGIGNWQDESGRNRDISKLEIMD